MRRSVSHSSIHNDQLDFARRVATAAAELPIEIVLSMVLEGLSILSVYRNRKRATNHEVAMLEAQRHPRAMLNHYRSLIEEFVRHHDMDSEESTAELGSTLTACNNVFSDTIQSMLSENALLLAEDAMDSEKRGGASSLAFAARRSSNSVSAAPAKAMSLDTSYYAMLGIVRKAFDRPIEGNDDDEDDSEEGAKTSGSVNRPRKSFMSSSSGTGLRSVRQRLGIDEGLFCEFVAPALTLSVDAKVNQRFVARTNVTQSGYISWEAFSNFFVKLHGDVHEETTQVKFISPAGDVQHNAAIRKLLFTKPHFGATSANSAMDRYCLSAGYDGTVHLWDTAYYDHVTRLHYIPNANKAKRWVNDMSFTGNGRLAIAQSRGIVYLYSVMNPARPYLHRVFRSASSLSDEEERNVRAEIERVRLQQGKTRYSAADIPQAEICVMTSPLPGDTVTVHGPSNVGKFSNQGHMEPLLVGLDTGLVHLYNVFKPIEFRAQVAPIITFSAFQKADVYQVMDHSVDYSFLCAGRNARGVPSIQVVDYEKSEATLVFQSKQTVSSLTTTVPSFTRFDFDDSIGLLVASGATRSATIFSTSFPDPVTTLVDHSAPLVGAAINAQQFQIFTFTEDNTFHLFDIRMFRKLQTFTDTHTGATSPSTTTFGCGAYDGYRGMAVGASSVPVALQLHQEQANVAAQTGNAVTSKRKQETTTPSGLATELRHVHFCNNFQSLIAAEGNYAVMRSGDDASVQDAAVALPDSIISFAVDNTERRAAFAVQGRSIHVLSTIGATRLLKWNCQTIDPLDEATCICFAFRRQGELVVVIGTFSGTVVVYDVANEGEVIHTATLPAAIVCMRAASHGDQRVLIGTVDGDVFLISLETMSMFHVLQFDEAHHAVTKNQQQGSGGVSNSSFQEGSIKERTTMDASTGQRVESKRVLRSDSLVNFRTRAYASMDKAVEAISRGFDDGHSVIMYGTGMIHYVRVSNTEVLTVLDFPSVSSYTSASAIAVGTSGGGERNLIVVGDFDGNVTIYEVRKVSKSTQQWRAGRGGADTGTSSDASALANMSLGIMPSVSAVGVSFAEYVVDMEAQISVSTKSLVSNICFAGSGTNTNLVVALSEVLQIAIIGLDGVVLSILSSEPQTVEPWAVGCQLPIGMPDSSHPFLVNRCRPSSREASQQGRTWETTTAATGSKNKSDAKVSMQAPPGSGGGDEPTTPPLVSEASVSFVATPSSIATANHHESNRGPKPTFRLPKNNTQLFSRRAEMTATSATTTDVNMSPRGVSDVKYPNGPEDVVTPIKLGCNEFPVTKDGAPILVSPRLTSSRPTSARTEASAEAAMARLCPPPAPPATARPSSGKSSHTFKVPSSGSPRNRVPQQPLIQYHGLIAHPSISTSDMERIRPPAYSKGASLSARPPSAPVFQYQKKTAEMSHKTDKMLQEAVDKANSISSRIVSNLRQRRLLSATTGARAGDDRVFLTLEQQPIPPDLVRAVANANMNKKR